jgi:hypothetical protein
VKVYNNAIFFEHSYPNAIEYRFIHTKNAYISNDLTNKAITSCDCGTTLFERNLTNATAVWFRNYLLTDLRLNGIMPDIADSGIIKEGLTDDIDGQDRPVGYRIDIGADELSPEIFNSSRR